MIRRATEGGGCSCVFCWARSTALVLGACAQQAPAPLTGEALVARGDYLVNGVVLCGDCHTPHRRRNVRRIETRRLQGAPNFRRARRRNLRDLSRRRLRAGRRTTREEQFIAFLQTGVRPDGSHPRPPMPPYRLNEEDARAVAAYIRSLPAAAQCSKRALHVQCARNCARAFQCDHNLCSELDATRAMGIPFACRKTSAPSAGSRSHCSCSTQHLGHGAR